MPYVEPLFVCVQRGELPYLIELLKKDPTGVNACDETGQTILHYACALGQVDVILYLLSRPDCKLSEQDHLYGYTPLHLACLYSHHRVVVELLKKLDSDTHAINIQDKLGWTVLHHAARNGSLEICKLLTSSKCKLDTENQLGKTACHYAAEHGHTSVLEFLYTFVEKTITPPLVTEDPPPCVPTLLHCAALNNHARVVEWLKQKSFPPTTKCRRTFDFVTDKTRDEFADHLAATRGHSSLKGTLSAYRSLFEGWIKDIGTNQVTLDRIKLCICGHPRAGKSAMRESLKKPYLRSLLGPKDAEETPDDDVTRHTFGIDISPMQLSGKDLFSVWDFAGQVESFITHQFFLSTESTIFTVVVDMTKPLKDQRAELLWWLGFIKTRNLGQVPFYPSRMEQEAIPMPSRRKEIYRQLQVKPWMMKGDTLLNGSNKEEDFEDGNSSDSQNSMYGSVLQPVPVVIVGSHLDLVPVDQQPDVVGNTQRLVDEMRDRFEEYLEISPKLYPLNCLRAVSAEMKVLKDRLCEVRSKLLEVQPRYPRVTEQVARKVEELRMEQPHQKVLPWDELRRVVKEEVNRLLSEKQLSYVCKCLANAGVLVYFDQSALSNYVFIDPAWLCRDVLGKALAPGSFPAAHLTPVGSTQISEDTLQEKFAQHSDKQHVPIIIELLQHFELCHRVKETSLFEFPTFITTPLDSTLWEESPHFKTYIGRRLVCADNTDAFPPGFFSRLQVQAYSAFRQEELSLFKGSFIVTASSYQCLVKMRDCNTAIDLIGRMEKGHSHVLSCIKLLDTTQSLIARLVRTACPSIFLDLQIISSSDLKSHTDNPHCYSVHSIISANASSRMVMNPVTSVSESAADLLYEGLQKTADGKSYKVAYLPDEIIGKIQELLEDGEKTWKDLAQMLGLDKYIQLLESRAPHSTRMLLLKWSERPRWTVHSLLCALKDIGREDVYNFLRAWLKVPDERTPPS